MVAASDASSPRDEDEGRRPVPPGRAWIHGHFTGIVTTASHCMEVSVPIQHEVPISSICPALAAFREASESAFEGDAAGHSPSRTSHKQPAASASRLSKKHWEELLAVFSAAAADCQQERPPEVPEVGAEAVREVEVEAKHALLQNVIVQRNNLKSENEAIKEELSQGPLKRMVTRSSKILLQGAREAMGIVPDDEGQPLRRTRTGPVLPRHRSRRRSSVCSEAATWGLGGAWNNHAKGAEHEDAEDEEEEGPRLKIHGHFTGHVTLQKHFLEVNLPVRGRIPGRAALELARALAGPVMRRLSQPLQGSPTAGGPEHSRKHAHEKGLPKIWERLSRLLAAELPEKAQRRSHKQDGIYPMDTLTPEVPPEAPAQRAPEPRPDGAEACPVRSSTGHSGENSRMVLVDIVELEEKMQELERLALQLTSLRPS